MIFGNPVRGRIHPASWKRPVGNLDFRVVQDFGPTSLLAEPSLSWAGGEGIAAGFYAHFHKGLDLGNGHCGADVLAPGAGTVHFAGMLSDGSNSVIVDHGGGWFSNSGHLATITVTKGQRVSRGQKVGTIGETGHAIGCHDHFMIKSAVDGAQSFFAAGNGKLHDPWPLLAQNVTVHPTAAEVNIRTGPGSGTTPASVFAETKPDGTIRRASDGASLGPFSTAHPWGGSVSGASYTIGGGGKTWEKVWLDGAWRYIATPLAARSAS